MSEDRDERRTKGGIAAAATAPTRHDALVGALGGPLGIAESSAPAALFVAVYTASGQDARLAAIVALALGGVLAVARIVRRETVQYALSGLAGLALAAFVVSRTGRAEDFFLPGLLYNGAYAVACVVSIAVRWPLVGVLLGAVARAGSHWRHDPAQLRTATRVTWIWAALFALRLVVQLPLYLAGAVVALGVARVAMGVPLVALGVWLSWLILRQERPGAPQAVR